MLIFFKAKNFNFPENFAIFSDFSLVSLTVFNFLDISLIFLISNFMIPYSLFGNHLFEEQL